MNAAEGNAQAAVSAWLTRSQLSYTTTFDGARFWQLPLVERQLLLHLLIYVAGSTFGVCVALRATDPKDNWKDEVWALIEPRIPFVRIATYQDKQGTTHPEILWFKVEVPLDLSFDPPILVGSMYQAVAAVQLAGQLALETFPNRFESHALDWINVAITSVPSAAAISEADKSAAPGAPAEST
jgi:hypothetical protein